MLNVCSKNFLIKQVSKHKYIDLTNQVFDFFQFNYIFFIYKRNSKTEDLLNISLDLKFLIKLNILNGKLRGRFFNIDSGLYEDEGLEIYEITEELNRHGFYFSQYPIFSPNQYRI